MAGGMDRSGRGRPLRERTGAPAAPPAPIAAPGPAAPGPASAPPGPAAPGPAPDLGGRHCWVLGHDEAGARWAGLLLEWRRTTNGWEGLVSYAVRDGVAVTLVQTWVPAAALVAR